MRSARPWLLGASIGLVAVAIRGALGELLPLGIHPQSLQIAIVVSALLLGWRGAVSTLVVVAAGGILFISAHLPLSDPADSLELLNFPLIALCLIGLIEYVRRLHANLGRALEASQRNVERLNAEVEAHQCTEERLSHSEDRYRRLVDLCPDAVFVCREGRMLFASRGMLQFTGASSVSELIGRHICDFLSPHDNGPSGQSRCCDARQRIREETWERHDGTTLECEAASADIMWDGSPAVQIALRDISARKAAERQLAEYRSRLERTNADLRDFTHLVAHDFKEPVRGIMNTATMLLADHSDTLTPRGREMVETLVTLPTRLTAMIQALLDYSRLGREQRSLEPCAVSEIIEDVRAQIGPWLSEQAATLEVESELPTVLCDRPRITEVFANLIINGVKYNRSPDKRVVVGATAAEPPAFYFRDNGIGIPQGKRKAVFEMFRRLHPRDAFGGGTGAGLALCRRIVESHGGRIWIEPGSGQGSVFWLTLAAAGPSGELPCGPGAIVVRAREPQPS